MSPAAQSRFPATVVQVLASDRIVINRGSNDGVRMSQVFVVYSLSPDPIIDPTSGDNLGYLELPKGTGSVIHVQERMAIIYTLGRFTGVHPGDQAKPV